MSLLRILITGKVESEGGISRRDMPWIVQSEVCRKSLSKEFIFRDRRDNSTAIRIKERWERWRSEILGDIFGQVPEIFLRIRARKACTFFVDEGGFCKLKTRFGTIPGRDIQSVISKGLKAHVLLVSSLSIFNSVRPSMTEPRPFSMRERESMWKVYFHPRDDNLWCAGHTQGGPGPESDIHSTGNQRTSLGPPIELRHSARSTASFVGP